MFYTSYVFIWKRVMISLISHTTMYDIYVDKNIFSMIKRRWWISKFELKSQNLFPTRIMRIFSPLKICYPGQSSHSDPPLNASLWSKYRNYTMSIILVYILYNDDKCETAGRTAKKHLENALFRSLQRRFGNIVLVAVEHFFSRLEVVPARPQAKFN